MLSRIELTKALIKGLKLDDNIFNYEAVNDEVASIQEHKYMDFYKDVMAKESYGNGLKAIIDTAKQFKPVVIDNVEEEAKELIALCESLNTIIRRDAEAKGEDFKKLVYCAKFPTLDIDKIVILDNVLPHYSHKELIINIRHYQTAKDALDAFKYAIKNVDKSLASIESSRVQKMIGVKK